MSLLYIVVESIKDWKAFYPSEDVITFEDYVSLSMSKKKARVRVLNLCRGYKYLSKGYYCSLLAEARGHHVIPSVKTLNDLRKRKIYAIDLELMEPDAHIALKHLKKETREHIDFKCYFGTTPQESVQPIARLLFERFQCPVMQLSLAKDKAGHWLVTSLKAISPTSLTDEEETLFAEALDEYSRKIWRKPKLAKRYRYDMAILHNPEEAFPPSDKMALKQFIKAGKRLGVSVDLIQPKDFLRLSEYDMLFIRETTAIDHHTFLFAKKAEAEGVVVIDDPLSIMRCTNKVFLADLFRTHHVPSPKTILLMRNHKAQIDQLEATLGFPLVLKIPDGSFSRGVVKVTGSSELQEHLKELFKQSALLLAQEYMYTPFDWRIGVLQGKPIYACKYFMARDHWQIYQHNTSQVESGDFETIPTYEVPKQVIKAAVKAANLIGDGLYGVDIKAFDDRVAVIEVNDNPSIDYGVEDGFLGAQLYELIIEDFIRRVENGKRNVTAL
ncbi:RimK family protein [Zooshikella marina]|uniref:RimK family protein n=1 Tax=Zooshikella ganghwensis TaxID=202772 RepID=UPI001BB099F4|nr:RimK family protein [Zooshikella ganghwensis]MBU2706702.1 RimK family protein [Zooshikella ganghwensis]